MDATSDTMLATGMSAHLGTKTQPSVAMLDHHVWALDQNVCHKYMAATIAAAKHLYASCADLASLTLWLGWLRSGKLFDSRWKAYTVVDPGDGHSVETFQSLSVLSCRTDLGETKSDRSQTANVVMAYDTLSGYAPG
jgi:uncharacterized membrane protein